MSSDLKAIANDLEYYLGRKPTESEVLEAQDWQDFNPDVNLCEYVEACLEIGAL